MLVLLFLVSACDEGHESTPAPSTSSRTTTQTRPSPAPGADWTKFGFDAARSGVGPRRTGITAANVGTMERQRIELPGTVDSSPIYLHRVRVDGARRDVFVVTTAYGRTLALDADTGEALWQFVPPGIERWEGTSQITNASPVADRRRGVVFSISPDGRLHKLGLADGREASAGTWPAVVTRDPTHEKIGPALNLDGDDVLLSTGGYIGDTPPYQGECWR